ncbi:MAG: pyridoxamine 5'-phosphate oxidase [Pseudomonadota bacterium]
MDNPLQDLASIRKQYEGKFLTLENSPSDPMQWFNAWLDDAIQFPTKEPTHMTLATVNADSWPDCRVVLLKGVDHGFIFYTNYSSQKGTELAINPKACINFFWLELHRQIRIQGSVEKVSDEISENYFSSRPVDSQVSAIISPQSQIVKDGELQLKLDSFKNSQQPVQRPSYWGGYRLIPNTIEFWQGQPNRLHNRIKFISKSSYSDGNYQWIKNQLAP